MMPVFWCVICPVSFQVFRHRFLLEDLHLKRLVLAGNSGHLPLQQLQLRCQQSPHCRDFHPRIVPRLVHGHLLLPALTCHFAKLALVILKVGLARELPQQAPDCACGPRRLAQLPAHLRKLGVCLPEFCLEAPLGARGLCQRPAGFRQFLVLSPQVGLPLGEQRPEPLLAGRGRGEPEQLAAELRQLLEWTGRAIRSTAHRRGLASWASPRARGVGPP
mmetsp:Transcript_664/g.2085  ORF Transcript_664/g.2085 Transcript_664/m.2085 type:complete len:218 (-) Transcript_664:17-670(-)